MPTVKEGASAFLASKRIAVTGVSRKPQRHGGDAVYKRLRERGYQVFVVNPAEGEVEGDDEDLAVLLCRRTAAMCPAGRADARARRLADLWAGVFALGLAPKRWVTLEVAGRRSGQIVRFPAGDGRLERSVVPGADAEREVQLGPECARRRRAGSSPAPAGNRVPARRGAGQPVGTGHAA
jgi:CoA binding domain